MLEKEGIWVEVASVDAGRSAAVVATAGDMMSDSRSISHLCR
jgi:hypothetical protein